MRKRLRPIVNEVTLILDHGAPIIDVRIDGIHVFEVQLDGGTSVNLINMKTMLGLQLTGLKETNLTLHMADQSSIKLVGVLP